MSKIHVVGCLDIARTEPHSFTRHLVGILRMGLPHLSKQLRDQNNKQKQQKKTKIKILLKKTIFFLTMFDIVLIGS